MKKESGFIRKTAVCAAAFLLAGSLAACGNTNGNASAGTESGSTSAGSEKAADSLSGKISLAGSTSMEKLCEALSESFMEANPDVTVTVEYTGSSAGVESLIQGSVDIGNASRNLKDGEKEKGAVENIVAIDGIAVITDKDNTVSDLTTEQLADVYTGKVTNWSELGGSDEAIVVIGREAGSGTRGAFEELLEVEDVCAYAQKLDSTGAVLAKECTDDLRPLADRKMIVLTCEGGAAGVSADPALIREMTENLVQNAIRYNKEQGEVHVEVSVINGHPTLSVKDTGIGIPSDQLGRIFERFYRVDKSRSRETGGTGLGLAIVKHIAELHNAEITVSSNYGEGTEFTVRF